MRILNRTAVLCLAFAALNIADIALTRILLERGYAELNPIFAPLLESWHGYALKSVVFVGVIGWIWHRQDPALDRVLWIGIGFYALVVGWNLLGVIYG
jgi:hypothetical protein